MATYDLRQYTPGGELPSMRQLTGESSLVQTIGDSVKSVYQQLLGFLPTDRDVGAFCEDYGLRTILVDAASPLLGRLNREEDIHAVETTYLVGAASIAVGAFLDRPASQLLPIGGLVAILVGAVHHNAMAYHEMNRNQPTQENK